MSRPHSPGGDPPDPRDTGAAVDAIFWPRDTAAGDGAAPAASAAGPAGSAVTVLPPLKERHRRFVLEYIIDLNGRAAAVRAGYARSKAGARASELIRRPEVQAFIREELKAREGRLRLSGDRIVAEAMRIAFADPGRIAHWGPDGVTLAESEDLAPADRAAVKWISVGGRKGATAQRFELHDKIAALELLARLSGMLTRAPGRGRFALLEDAPEDAAAAEARHEETRAKLVKLIEAKANDLAEEKFKAMRAAAAAAKTGEDDKQK